MSDEGFIPIEDPRISEKTRAEIRAGIQQTVTAHHRLIQPLDIKWTISALQRVLYAINGQMEDSKWRDVKEKAEHPDGIRIDVHLNNAGFPDKVQHGRRPEKWFRIHEITGEISYIQISDDSGRFSKERPSGVKDEDIIEIKPPKEPPSALRNFLETLIAQLNPTLAEDLPFVEAQKRRRPSLLAMYSPNHANEVAIQLEALYRDILSKLPNYSFETLISQVISGYTNFLVEGDFCAKSLLIACTLKHAQTLQINISGIDALSANLSTSWSGILNRILAHDPKLSCLQAACEEMQERGEQLQLAALDTNSVGDFYGNIYISIPWVWGAYLGFRFLTEKAPGTPAFKIATNVCDERIANAATSLLTAFLDTLDTRALSATRNLISRKRRLAGEAAAEALADHHIEVMLEYPRYFKPILLGKDDQYRIRKPTK